MNNFGVRRVWKAALMIRNGYGRNWFFMVNNNTGLDCTSKDCEHSCWFVASNFWHNFVSLFEIQWVNVSKT